MAEYHPGLSSGLASAIGWLDRYEGMWPAAAFAVIGVAGSRRVHEASDTLAVHVQALTQAEEPALKTTLTSPLAIEGVTEIANLRRLLECWAAHEVCDFEGWYLPPPKINGSNWDTGALVSEHYPLARGLPPADSRYREARLAGHGEQLDGELHNWLTRQAQELTPGQFHPQLFSREYLGGSNWAFGSYYLLLHFPQAVALSAVYDPASQVLEAIVRLRPPLQFEDFELRAGDRMFNASLATLDLAPQGLSEDGWVIARAASDWEPGVPAKVWLTQAGSDLSFGWDAAVNTGRADSLELRQERFLQDWYTLAARDFVPDLDVRSPGMGKGDSPAAMFETALANVMTALGFAVFTAGGPMKTRAIDLMAFDRGSGRAYAISATVGNDLPRKLMSWANAESAIRAALEPVWEVRPVVISSQPWDALLEEHRRACHAHRVLVLGAEHLRPLKEAIPDLKTFRDIFMQEPPPIDALDPHGLRRYGRP